MARLRPGNARRADRRARPDRRRPRPLHDQLEPGRAGPWEEELGECGFSSRGSARPRDRARRDALRRSALGNGGRAPNWAPTSGSTFAAFASAAAKRYPWVKLWLVWNEPNQRRWLRPTTPQTYVTSCSIPPTRPSTSDSRGEGRRRGHRSARLDRWRVAGRLDPRDGSAGARLDAYAHNPYPLNPVETPSRRLRNCSTITMATLEQLQREVSRTFGGKRIWLTEYGYQTNPPDRALGVS